MATAAQAQKKSIRVAADGSGDYTTVQAAVDHLPAGGGTVLIAPGSYREQVIINQSHVTLRGTGPDPSAVTVVDDTSQGTRGTKPSYATVHVLGDDFRAENLTFQNDFNRTHQQVSAGSQAQALNLEGDRNILTHVRILANQDTLYVGATGCGQSGSLRTPAPSNSSFPPTANPMPVPKSVTPCIPRPTRSYFTHCVIAGNVDFIYGDGNAVFEDCEIHSTEHAAGGYLTAQGKYLKDQQSTFVFDHCRMTADPGEQHVFLGRPWRDYASVVYMHCVLGPHIDPAGWREWGAGTHRLETAFYAEYDDSGPGFNLAARDPHSHQLTAAQAKQYDPRTFLAGSDHWNPVKLAK
ncbi:MAG TPA: pectinesterase family protein [Acidobacteriaceae bacterium]|nr:pectinesterase family protein [Acidobacteriaceae bacterium]